MALGVTTMGLKKVTQKFVQNLEARYGPIEKIAKGFVLNFGNQITCTVRYSKIHKGNSCFYGIEQDFLDSKFKEGAKSPLGVYGIFIWGSEGRVFILPQKLLIERMKSAPTNRVHIDRHGDQYYLRISGQEPLDITSYLNNFPIPIEHEAPADRPMLPEPVETQEQSIREHTRIQYFLIKFGKAAGYDVWVAPQDRNLSFGDEKFTDLSTPTLPNFGFDPMANSIIRNIDVLWLERNVIQKAFEIEATTSVYSGLLRLSDLVLLQPNTTIDLNLVAPLSRREIVRKNVLRPTFENLRKKCSYISFEEVVKKFEMAKQVIKLQSHLKISLESERF
ncbi:MAG: hypothetical protein ACRECJ_01070 [Limisphaerales bacterium]